ncbi:MAG: hypothetical protein JKY32_03310, partial [Rhizobiales bacterium]|nr:hypothetical protein [Hyphomicrobiales bacterium]
VIEQFRYDEIWDDGEFLKTSHAPLAIGDVFETIAGDTTRRFILLGQPCDLALRGDGKRSAQIGQLVSFKKISNDRTRESTVYAGRKIIDLQIGKDGGYFRFDYRQASPAQLEILDLATFNESGEVAVQGDQDFKAALLPGQAKGLRTANKLLERIVDAQNNAQEKPDELRKADARCKLTLSFDGHFKSVCTPTFSKNGKVAKLDWNLKRTKRLRSPYVDILMDQQLAILNRRALELDYLDETETVTADCGTGHPSAVD